MKTISLNGTWQLRGREQESDRQTVITMSAEVPGSIALDLSQNGYLPKDLFMGENIRSTEQFEGYEWWYERCFTAPEERENVFLVFEGVDCLADYYLNGQHIGSSENMMIAHEFEVGAYLCEGENMLCVHLHSAVVAAHYEDLTIHGFPSWNNAVIQTSIRRAPHTYGWDIMPRAVTAGLWRGVRLEVRDEIYFSQLFFHTKELSCTAMYELKCGWKDLKNVEVVFKGSCGGDSSFEEHVLVNGVKAAVCNLNIQNPKQWMPYGYGTPNVYEVTAQIFKDGRLIHEKKDSFGLRSVVLERTDVTDGEHGCFRFLINGIEIMCKGSNWVPLDAFHSRDAQRYERALALVKDIGCNILRCWGGNVYEDHAFFDFCDRNGIMVWQDFSMACRIYPENERFQALISKEATAVIRKLRNHPSIILWSGDNETDHNYRRIGDPSQNRLTRELLPNVVKLNDIGRPYLASSPYVSGEYHNRIKEMGISSPEDHLWGARDYFKSDYYKNSKAHFVSETGYHGCPSLESIKRFITPERVWPYQNNPEWILHSSDQEGNDSRVMLMEKQVIQLFGALPKAPEDYVLASQISQAEAKKYFIERMRVGRPQKTGIIWWNLLDGWPQMSDAVVDYYFTKKLAYSYIKRAQAPFAIIAGEIKDWKLPIYACNDTLESRCGHFCVRDAESGKLLLEKSFDARANATTRIATLPIYYSSHQVLIFTWEENGRSSMNHYLCGYPPINFEWYCQILRKYGLQQDGKDVVTLAP